MTKYTRFWCEKYKTITIQIRSLKILSLAFTEHIIDDRTFVKIISRGRDFQKHTKKIAYHILFFFQFFRDRYDDVCNADDVQTTLNRTSNMVYWLVLMLSVWPVVEVSSGNNDNIIVIICVIWIRSVFSDSSLSIGCRQM